MSVVLVVAPHADDETLGCGGSLLRHRSLGDDLHWLLVTDMTQEAGYSEQQIAQREEEISQVADAYGFTGVHRTGFQTTRLDTLPVSDIVSAFETTWQQVSPETIYLPFSGDVHSDHRVVADAAIACTKWFRHPSVRRVLAYETLSETDFGIDPGSPAFRPTSFVDISDYLDGKVAAMNLYHGEVSRAPFPRSAEVIRAQAIARGAQAGFHYAEAFMLLRERQTNG